MSIRKLPQIAAVLTALTLGVAACGGGSAGSTGGSGTTTNEGTPVKGGTLNMLGNGDVDFMDPNVTYYSIGYEVMRLFSRQLYNYPAVKGKETSSVPDLASGPVETSSDGLTETVKLTPGIQWNTTPARDITAQDVVRGVKRTCNPAQPFGGLPDYEDLIVGLTTFCDGFAKVKGTDAKAMGAYIENTDLPGVQATDANTVVFKLTTPASYFQDLLTLNAFDPAPIEYNAYVPAGAELGQHMISDGPYKIDSYSPTKLITLSRNPVWKAETDPIRKAYVDKIVITQGITQDSTQDQLQTGNPKADMEFDNWVPPTRTVQLKAQNDPLLNLGTTSSSLPSILFNQKSPNNGGAMKNLLFRQALEYGISRDNIIQNYGGPVLNPPLAQVLPKDIVGGEQQFNMYPYNVDKAKALIAQAGVTNPTLTMLYNKESEGSTKTFQTVQADLAKVGITVKPLALLQSDIYSKYLPVPSVAEKGTWDISMYGWGPDWYGNAAASYFKPLYSTSAFPPGGANYGFYSSAKVDALIQQAGKATTEDAAAALWHQADQQVMADAGFFPVTSPLQPNYRAKQVKNAIYIPTLQNFDATNVWLDPAKNGG